MKPKTNGVERTSDLSSAHQRVISRPLGPPGAAYGFERLQRISERMKKELWLLVPEPRRSDIELEILLFARENQFHAQICMRPSRQAVLALDEVSAMPLAEAIALEIATLESRIVAEYTQIVARVDSDDAVPLSPRQRATLELLGGRNIPMNLTTGPLELRFPDEPSAVAAPSSCYRGVVFDHTPECLQLARTVPLREGDVGVTHRYWRTTLRLSNAPLAEQARAHYRVSELFIEGGDRALQFEAMPYISPVTGAIAFLEFVRLL